METKQKKEKVGFNFQLPKDLEAKWRIFVANRHGGYRRGAYTQEVQLAIRHYMESEGDKQDV